MFSQFLFNLYYQQSFTNGHEIAGFFSTEMEIRYNQNKN